MTLKQVTTLLKPKFSEEGTNDRQFEGAVYGAFVKYLREVASKSVFVGNTVLSQ